MAETVTTKVTAASKTAFGTVKIGDNINVADGVISVTPSAAYTLPAATASVLGGVKVGSNLSVTADGTLSATDTKYTLPKASATVLGGVIQGSNVTIDSAGKISAPAPVTDSHINSLIDAKLKTVLATATVGADGTMTFTI